MPGKFEAPRTQNQMPQRRRRRRRRRRNGPAILFAVLAAVLLMLIIGLVVSCSSRSDSDAPTEPAETLPAETTQAPLQAVSTATISSQGDLLMHKPIHGAYIQEDGSYDFSPIFRYMKEHITAVDYSVANLETTFGGPNYPYQGNPRFNCPDAFSNAAAEAGFDMLLTANNHSSDTYTDGILRTLEQVQQNGMQTLGTQRSDAEKKYSIVDVNGISVGMVCYTYATNENGDGYPSLNYKEFVTEKGIVNYFTLNDLDQFYQEMQTHMTNMRADGAQATMLYIHWGEEYTLTEDQTQRQIAQRMCDLGFDVIVGGHPHVVQPMALLTSNNDPDHKTVCLYSMGNAVSNQMRNEDEAFASGHTEDGVFFTVTFEAYSDGTVALTDVDVLPTWVLRTMEGDVATDYVILPLDIDDQSQWTQRYGLSDQNFLYAQDSYRRTMDILGQGLSQCRAYLEEAREARLGLE